MERFVVMVDAGYLLVQAVKILSEGKSFKRSELHTKDPSTLVKGVVDSAIRLMGLKDNKELLRVYWYDGVGATGPSSMQRLIMDVDDVQLRAGTINGKRQQKGVDSLIVTDLVELATNRAVCDAIVVTGDSDLAVGIEIAQKRGVRLGVLGVEQLVGATKVTHGISPEISGLADRVGFIDVPSIFSSLTYVPATPEAGQDNVVGKPSAPKVKNPGQDLVINSENGQAAVRPAIHKASSAARNDIQEKEKPVAPLTAIKRLAEPLSDAVEVSLKAVVEAYVIAERIDETKVDRESGRVNSAVDRALLAHIKGRLGRGLTPDEKVEMRDLLRSAIFKN